ncbi:MAG: SbcC/MukB-like Walker B domain-containing protein [Psittacicella sp.]
MNNFEIKKGKFLSLSLINWNGFFAKRFILDDQITTLSGGNGSGKSTTMAGFITALIPDLSLLNFKNTTEASQINSSKDKGLFGKLMQGSNYSILEAKNSFNDIIYFGVYSLKGSGINSSAELKPFIIKSRRPLDIFSIFLVKIDNIKAKIIPLSEIKSLLSSETEFKTYNSILEYHNALFNLGILPRKMRTSGDRARFYRIIEASLYGGISSTVAKSLKQYILPEHDDIKKAFVNMELALNENKKTLLTIADTEKQKDFFKELLELSLNYVGSDYVRHLKLLEINKNKALANRQDYYNFKAREESLRRSLTEKEKSREKLSTLIQDLNLSLKEIELKLIRSEFKEKLNLKKDELEIDIENLQDMIFDLESNEENLSFEIDSLKESSKEKEALIEKISSELIDLGKRFDERSIEIIKYKKTIELFEKIKLIIPDLERNNIDINLNLIKFNNKEILLKINSLKLSLNSEESLKEVYKKYESILISLDKKDLLENKNELKIYLESIAKSTNKFELNSKEIELSSLKKNLTKYLQIYDSYNKYKEFIREEALDISELSIGSLREISKEITLKIEESSEVLSEVDYELENLNDELNENSLKEKELNSELKLYSKNKALISNYSNKFGTNLNTQEDFLKRFKEIDKELNLNYDKSYKQKDILKVLEEKKSQLSSIKIRESSINLKNDKDLDPNDVFGSFGNFELFKDLKDIKSLIDKNLENGFDIEKDDLFLVKEDALENFFKLSSQEKYLNGTITSFNDNFIRFNLLNKYKTLTPEEKNEKLKYISSQIIENLELNKTFNLQKQALEGELSIIREILSIDFSSITENPENILDEVLDRIYTLKDQIQDLNSRYFEEKETINFLEKIKLSLDTQEFAYISLNENIQHLEINILESKDLQNFYTKNIASFKFLESNLLELERYLALPKDNENSLDDLKNLENIYLSNIETENFLEDLLSRQEYFKLEHLLDESNLFDNSLLERQLSENKKDLQELISKLEIKNSLLSEIKISLGSSRNSLSLKQEDYEETSQELLELSDLNKDDLELKSQEKTLALNKASKENEILNQEILEVAFEIKSSKDIYPEKFEKYVNSRKVFLDISSILKDIDSLEDFTNIKNSLKKDEFLNLNDFELRSISDRSLGSLKQTIKDELLSSILSSENSAGLNFKINFIIKIYDYLRSRIRRDIIGFDDPILAINKMEEELVKLKEELKNRENSFSLTSYNIASILRRTIKKEELKILELNSNLTNVSFGQIKGVRLKYSLYPAYEKLLDQLAKIHNLNDILISKGLSFSEYLGNLFYEINAIDDINSTSLEEMGTKLLDYRNYISISLEILRVSSNWKLAESNSLSTGESIGVGMSVLFIIIQSWEDESSNFRDNNISPCRLLFLDEAARLDDKSISTLFELCSRLNTQLLIAAPDNINSGKGLTYKLIRHIKNGKEYVDVIGLKGF